MNIGDKFEQSFQVTNEIYEGFIRLFNDKNPLHTDGEFALEKGFSSVVMHGNILNGYLSFFIGECLPLKNVIIQTQEIKYFKPVYLNDALTLQAEITDVHSSVNLIEMKYGFYKSDKVKVAGGKINIGII
jgi:3-hydroxybutyryl-CoA dehydratase